MAKILLTSICLLWATFAFAQTSFTLKGVKIDTKGKEGGKFTLNADYRATYQDFVEIKDGKVIVTNLQVFLDEKTENNKDVVIYTASIADINPTFLEENFIHEDKEHTSFKEDSYELRLYPKDGIEFKSWHWGRMDKAGETPKEYSEISTRIAFAKLADAKAFLAQLKKMVK